MSSGKQGRYTGFLAMHQWKSQRGQPSPSTDSTAGELVELENEVADLRRQNRELEDAHKSVLLSVSDLEDKLSDALSLVENLQDRNKLLRNLYVGENREDKVTLCLDSVELKSCKSLLLKVLHPDKNNEMLSSADPAQVSAFNSVFGMLVDAIKQV